MAPFNNYFAYYQPVSIKQEGYTVDPCLIISIGKCIHTHYLSLSLYSFRATAEVGKSRRESSLSLSVWTTGGAHLDGQ